MNLRPEARLFTAVAVGIAVGAAVVALLASVDALSVLVVAVAIALLKNGLAGHGTGVTDPFSADA